MWRERCLYLATVFLWGLGAWQGAQAQQPVLNWLARVPFATGAAGSAPGSDATPGALLVGVMAGCFYLVVFGWLGLAAWQDLRTRQVSNWLTLTPLVAAAAGHGLAGDLVPVLLLAGILMVDLLPGRWPLVGMLAVCAATTWLYPIAVVVIATWAVAYLLVGLNFLGGADAKLAMTLIVLFPSPLMAAAMAGSLVAISLAVLVVRYKALAVLVVVNATRALLGRRLPERAELEAHGVPMAGAFLLAFVVFMLYEVLA